MSYSLRICTHNVRGLHLHNKNLQATGSPTYISLKPHALASDLIVLTETKVVLPSNPGWNQFTPFGKNFAVSTYSCTGPSNGIMVIYNSDTITISNDYDIIVPGRLIALTVQHKASSQTYLIFAAYLPAGQDFTEYTNCLDLLSAHISAHSNHTIFVVGDLNADIYNHQRAHLTHERYLTSLIARHGLVDICRLSGKTDPTYYPPPHSLKHSSTLDYILVNSPLIFKNIAYTISPASDHVIITANNDSAPPPIGSTIRNKLFENTKFQTEAKAYLSTIHDNFCNTNQHRLQNTQSTTYLDWLSIMIDSLSFFNMRFAKENITSIKKAEHKYRISIKKVLAKLKHNDTPENRTELEAIKKSHHDYIEQHMAQMRSIARVRKAVHHAQSHKFCFTKFQNRGHRSIQSITCPDTGCLLINKHDIAEAFAKFHKSKVAHTDTSVEELDAGISKDTHIPLIQRVLNKHNLSLGQFFPSMAQVTGQITIKASEIAEAIASFKNDSAPGPSGQGKQFFSFLFKFNKTFFTTAINQLLLLPDIDASNFAWIKKRKIVFIKKKKDTPATHCSDFRPISLLEQLYKILAKITLSRSLPHMTSIISPNQFGFCPGRAMSLANLSTLHVIDVLRHQHAEAAMLFIDIKSAFDSISTDTLDNILKHIFPNSPLPNIIHSLSAGGVATVEVNNFLSHPFRIYKGAGQGDNLSSFKYNIIHHLFIYLLWELIKTHLPHSILTFSNTHKVIEPICYADDSSMALKIGNEHEAGILLKLFQDVKLATGLQINPSKSQILLPCPQAIRPAARLGLQMLGIIVNKTTHLGLEISTTQALSSKFTWEKALDKLELKMARFQNMIGYEDMLHKKLLCSTMLHSSLTHIMRVFHPSQDMIESIDKKLLKTLWQKRFQGKVYGRSKVAKNRVSYPISKGGLNWKTIESRSFTSVISSFFHTIKFIISEPTSNLSQIFPINQNKLFTRGSLNLTYLLSLMAKMFPSITNTDLPDQFNTLVKKLENHRDYLLFAPPLHNSIFLPFPLTEHDISPTNLAIGHLLENPPSQQTHDTNSSTPPINWNMNKITSLPTNTQTKLQNALPKIRKIIKTLPNNTATSHLTTHNFIYQAVHKNNALFTKAYYKLRKEDYPKLPPSYSTRVQQGASVPQSPENFSLAYTNMQKAKIPSHTKSFILDILNRTAPSRRILHKANILPDTTCPRCDVISDSFHTQFECSMAYMAYTALSKHFSSKLPTISLNEENFCFFVPLKNASKNMNDQFLHLFGSFSHLAFSILTHERFHIWSPMVLYAKLLANTDMIIQIRKGAKLAFKELVSFRDTFVSLIDYIELDLVAPNRGHFRAFPPLT